MFNIGAGELLAILALALLVLGPGRLPEAVRTAGRVMGEVRRISGDLQRELRTALDEDPAPDDPAPDDDHDPDDDVVDDDGLDVVLDLDDDVPDDGVLEVAEASPRSSPVS